MKSRFVTIGIAGMFLIAACSTSYNAQKTSNDDLYSAGSSQEAPTNSSNRQVQSSPASSQVINPTVIEDHSDDQNATPDNYSQNNYSPNSYNDNSDNTNTYNGYSDGYGSQWSDASMSRMGCASASFGYYGPASSGFTFYSPLYYSPGFSLGLGFSFGSGNFYNPGWNSFGWMPVPPPVYYYPYYPVNPYMYDPFYMNSYAFGDPYGYYGGYYGGSYPNYNNYNQYYSPRNSTSNNTSNNGRLYVPEHRNGSGNTIPGVTHINSSNTGTTRTTAPLASPQMQNQRRFNPNPPAVSPSAPRTAPSNNNNNSGRPHNQYRPMPQAYNMPQQNQPIVVYRNDINQQRVENSQSFHQSLNQENNSRGFEQHAVQSSGRNISTSSSGTNTPHSNGNRQYR